MREIKFRAWDKTTNKMGEVEELISLVTKEYKTSVLYCDDESGTGYECSYDFVLMQYTGLKDRNGREIYEGDILANKKAFNRSFKVIWNPDGAWFVHDGDDWPCYYLRQVNKSTEVIGNVFEHPELLEVKKV
ncbi:YopX family protein [Aneurinibacillus aneurinilyticus]|uniref:YopX family protein n=1 Tax=Aneurinibacillus aneurinilyticus TaxID=1391 RepID=UPI0036702921